MEWTPDITLYFIELVRKRRIIWDPRMRYKKFYKSKRPKAFDDIALALNMPQSEVKSKWVCLRKQYIRQKQKILAVQGRIGQQIDKSKLTSWFPYKAMDNFMDVPLIALEFKDKLCDELPNNSYVDEDSESNKEWGADSSQHSPISSFQSNGKRMNGNDSNDPLMYDETVRKRLRPNVIQPRLSHNQKLSIEYDMFGQYVAAQMKCLTEEDAVLAQTAINEIMCRFRLKSARLPERSSNCQTGGPNSPEAVDEDVCIVNVKCETEMPDTEN